MLLNSNESSNIIPNNSYRSAKSLSVKIIVQKKPQNLLICQCLGEASSSSTIKVAILNPLTSDASFPTEYLFTKKVLQGSKLEVPRLFLSNVLMIWEK